MKLTYLTLLSLGLIPCITGCASTPIALAPVGPGNPNQVASGTTGYLKVYTATRRVDVDFQAYFNPHVGYDIDDLGGRNLQFVANHSSDMDEAPDTVGLEPGHYQIVAESTWCGLVTIPVTIEPGKTTVIHLDGSWHRPAQSAPNQVVYLPNGEPVGWSTPLANAAP